MPPELLKSNEYLPSTGPKPPEDLKLTPKDVGALMGLEFQMLESLRPNISRKLLFMLEAKLNAQKQELEHLLGLDKNIAASRSKYSNVLDTQYFEQIFL